MNSLDDSEIRFQGGCEEELQTLLEEHPEVFPINELNARASAVIVVGREVSVGSDGKVDLLLLDDTGRLYVVECKLFENRESRREVVAQALDYGLEISKKWDGAKVLSIAEKHFDGVPALAEIERRFNAVWVAKKVEEPPNMGFIKALKASKPGGIRIALVIAANRVQVRAMALLEFMRECLGGKGAGREPFDLACIECRRYTIAGADYLSCTLKSAGVLETVTANQSRRLNEAEWLESEAEYREVRAQMLNEFKLLGDICSYEFRISCLAVFVKNSRARAAVLYIQSTDMSFNRESFEKLGMARSDYVALLRSVEQALGLQSEALPAERPNWCSTSLEGLRDEQKRRCFFDIISNMIRGLRQNRA